MSGGEFFTPQIVSKLIAKLAIHNQSTINKIYDPAAGSESLLLQAKKQSNEHIIEDRFFDKKSTIQLIILWLTQKAIVEQFGVEVLAVSKHLSNIFSEVELQAEATVSKMETIQN